MQKENLKLFLISCLTKTDIRAHVHVYVLATSFSHAEELLNDFLTKQGITTNINDIKIEASSEEKSPYAYLLYGKEGDTINVPAYN